MEPESTECFVCRKHRGEIVIPGGAIFEDDLVYCGHAWSQEGDQGMYLGACIVEPRRHLPSWGELLDNEAARMGIAIRNLARALQQSEAAEHVYIFVLGHHIPHLHVWVIPRYKGTPREYWGLNLLEWPERPTGSRDEVTALCDRLRAALIAKP